MKNADMPAHPQAATSEGYGCNYTENFNGQIPTGLTKREMFAMHAMKGIMFDVAFCQSHDEFDVATLAVKQADALLAELEK